MTTIHWQAGVSGDWTQGSDWVGGIAPGPGDDAVIDAGGSYTVAISTSVTANSLTLNDALAIVSVTGSGAHFGALTLTTGVLQLNSGSTALGTSILNGGQIAIDGGGRGNTFLLIDASVTLSGGGIVNLSTATGGGNAIIEQVNNNFPIEGAGIIGNGGLGLVNAGIIDADAAGQTLTLNGSQGVTNTGLFEATGGGTLSLSTAVTNTGGSVTADGGTVNVGATLTGGTLATSHGGVIETVGTAVLSGVTIAAASTYTASNGANTDLTGTIANSGTIELSGGAGINGLLNIAGNVTLSGGGIVNLTTASGGGNAVIEQIDNNFTLTNQDNTIEGTGIIGNGGLTVVNGGTIDADSPAGGGTLLLNGAAITNTNGATGGLLEASNGGTLQISTTIDNGGGNIAVGDAASTVQLLNATVRGGTLNNTAGGLLESAGTAMLDGSTTAGAVTLDGIYRAANSTSTDLLGIITNSGTIQLNGGAGANGFLNIAGNVSLSGGGTVNLTTATGGGNAIIEQINNNFTLTNQDNTIEGAGIIGNGGLGLANAGTIDADAAAQTLTLNGSQGVTNTGLLEATGSGTLSLSTAVTNTGNITADGGTVNVSATITGGTFATSHGGVIETVGTGVLSGVTIAAASTYTASDGANTDLNGTITNSGTIQLNGGGGINGLLNIAGNVTLSGGGIVNLTTASGGGNALVEQINNNFTLTNQDNIIQGAGIIGNGGLGLVNARTIDAGTAGQTLTLNGSQGVTNTGLLEATGSGILAIDTNVANTSGNITADGGTVQVVSSATLTGGTLATLHGGVIETVGTAILSGVTIAAGSIYTASDGANTDLLGIITNSGTIQLNGGAGANGFLNIASNVTLAGGGIVNLTTATGGGNAVIEQINNNFTLTNQDNTIEGTGIIGNGGLGLANAGTVNADAAGQTLTLNGSQGVTNTGLLEATGGGTLSLSTSVTNTGGSVTTDGGTVNLSATITGGTLATARGGVIETVGTAILSGVTIAAASIYTASNGANTDLTGQITNSGTIQLNGGAGINGFLNIASNVTLSGGGTVNLTTLAGGGNAVIEQINNNFTLTNQDNTIEGAGIIGNGGLGFVNAAAGTVDANAAGQTLLLNGSGALANNGVFEASSGGVLDVVNAITGSGQLLIGTAGLIELSGATAETASFTGASGTLKLDHPSSYTGTIAGFSAGDTLDLANTNATGANPGVFDGTITPLTITVSGGSALTYSLAGDYTGFTFRTNSDGSSGTTITPVPCFCRGTRILTDRGELPVEALAIGDRVMTGSGAARPIKWIGRRSYAGRFLRGNPAMLPIVIKEGALADGVPLRDLWISPHHALYLDGVLVPAEHLVNGVSVLRCEEAETIAYFHIELEAHDIIYAEGAAAETFVDCDCRGIFHNADEFARLYPKAAAPSWAFCAPRIEEGERLEALRRRLALRFLARAPATASDLHLVVNGCAVLPDRVAASVYRFSLPERPTDIRIASRNAAPRELGLAPDRRRLGVSLERIMLRSADVTIEINPAETSLVEGFHEAEPGHRWTDGNARLPRHFCDCLLGGSSVEIHAAALAYYPIGASDWRERSFDDDLRAGRFIA